MGKRVLVCLGSFLLLSACATVNRDREAALLHLRIGSGHLEKGNYPAALRELLKAEALDPENELIQNNLGLAYFVRERNDLAEKHLQQALKINPKFTEARNNLARVRIEMGLYESAIRDLRVVLQDLTYPSPDKAWVNMGLAYFRSGEYKTAKEKLAEAIRLNRRHCLAHTLFGRSLLEMGELKEAAASLDNAVALCRDSGFDEPHYYSGLTYYKLGRGDQSRARMEEVIKLYPHGKYAEKAKSVLQMIR